MSALCEWLGSSPIGYWQQCQSALRALNDMKRVLFYLFFVLFAASGPAHATRTNAISWNETTELGKGFWMRLACVGNEHWLGVITRFPGHKAPSWLELV